MNYLCLSKVPRQQNGYDCGVFVIRFAQMIIDKWPSSTFEDMEDKFRNHFLKEFTQDDISTEREAMKILLTEYVFTTFEIFIVMIMKCFCV